ncbi:MAG: hypothetical protein NT154_22520 [Verrucomicrobia bacterium]|nr:hypothetical protein [Verrucomicrobiota bacterium]
MQDWLGMAALFSEPRPDAPVRQSSACDKSDEHTSPPAQSTLQDGRNDFGVIFIHSRLDDYGLSPQEFRV